MDIILGVLDEIERKIEADQFEWRTDRESVHMNIEAAMPDLISEPAKKLHTARSRTRLLLISGFGVVILSIQLLSKSNILRQLDAPQDVDHDMEPAQYGDQDIQISSTEVRPSDRTRQTDRAVYRINLNASRKELRLEPRPNDQTDRPTDVLSDQLDNPRLTVEP